MAELITDDGWVIPYKTIGEPPVEQPTPERDDELTELELSRMNDEGCPHG